MGISDDFAMWEAEVDPPAESSNTPGMIVVSLILMAGSGALIALGVTLLGISALVILAGILILWRSGM
ncbi:MAG TPA: hypothetical protein VE465_17760 [Streptosporangiaceae bacterium]|jgi:hypothetical protein|nr:hypothetical protein [Streptosporangiaceae bacterium]